MAMAAATTLPRAKEAFHVCPRHFPDTDTAVSVAQLAKIRRVRESVSSRAEMGIQLVFYQTSMNGVHQVAHSNREWVTARGLVRFCHQCYLARQITLPAINHIKLNANQERVLDFVNTNNDAAEHSFATGKCPFESCGFRARA